MKGLKNLSHIKKPDIVDTTTPSEKLEEVGQAQDSANEDLNPIYDHRAFLSQADQKSQDDYDKTVLALSGGALGISFAFIKDLLSSTPVYKAALLTAWITWTLSLCIVLLSYFTSRKSIRKGIEQVDRELETGKPIEGHFGGVFAKITGGLNVTSGILFVIGIAFFIAFVYFNLGGINVKTK